MDETDLKNYLAATSRTPRLDIEALFRSLIGWPGDASLAGSTAKERMAGLMQCCQDLAVDYSVLPASTLAAVLDGIDLSDAGADPRAGATYALAVKIVASNLNPWLDRLRAPGHGT